MIIIQILIDLATSPHNYPIVWLILSWFVWVIIGLFKRTRPAISTMLIYSTAVAIFFVRDGQRYCPDLCVSIFELLPFLAEVAFWFTILYTAITFSPAKILKFGKYGWFGLLIIGLATWHFVTESISITHSLKTPAGVEITLITALLGLLFPWVLWLVFVGLWKPNQSSVKIMLIYSVSVILTFIRVLYDAMIDQESFSLISFLKQTAFWFIPLYALLKLVSKMATEKDFSATS